MISIVITMIIFSFVMSASPGPVNVISLSIGMNSGFKSALPFVSGATVGFTLLLFLTGVGLGNLVIRFPLFMNLLSILGASFIIYMGAKMWGSTSTLIQNSNGKNNSFFDGAAMQWLNPKAWAASMAGVSAFDASDSFKTLTVFTSIYFSICYVGILGWAYIGEKIFMRINNISVLTTVNKTLGGLLIVVGAILGLQKFV